LGYKSLQLARDGTLGSVSLKLNSIVANEKGRGNIENVKAGSLNG
jgi:hypothetical protein